MEIEEKWDDTFLPQATYYTKYHENQNGQKS